MQLFKDIQFLLSVHKLHQLPPNDRPEIAFAGRSNVGKSSLLNSLFGRKGLVKVSGRPGKTQGLNFFTVDDRGYMVDLPGYGYAKVAKSMQASWQELITKYLEGRSNLCCVVVIMDIRHSPKEQDAQLINWLRQQNIKILAVYTKVDKLSGNQRSRNARALDAGHGFRSDERVLFSALSGFGLEELRLKIETILSQAGEAYL